MANIFWASYYCSNLGYNIRHNVGDLVWDIIELKTGIDPDTENEKEVFFSVLKEIEVKWNGKEEKGCEAMYEAYGEGAHRIPDVIYKR